MSLLLQAEALVAGWSEPATPALDLQVAAGEIVGLTGPNGVGKSTLLAAAVGRARIFSGRLTMAPGLRLALQTQQLPPVDGLPLSGHDLLAVTGAVPAGLPPWLEGRLGERLDQLSGGQRHYLALWAAIAVPADLLLLDEPTNNLDAAGVRHLAQALRQRAAAGVGILIVSHDADFVAALCHRTLVLEAPDVV
ncbi:MAG: ATP-binding cassette domain-containing protein [Azonexus sp.]|jgi:ATPase subunit of ABC transporter with duplicated ATPase domains|uniref:ATP-binding cassette domain-containing protein n=1 Tax=Azonexus sp. TaxID=1872668 RepID=UPI00281A2CE1|nr:ATP-binding cassette domain-containing protein [Azonexus sp.]MDR0775785.1 ATP-binding cassette domain-containing protein [Azonexus sp.]